MLCPKFDTGKRRFVAAFFSAGVACENDPRVSVNDPVAAIDQQPEQAAKFTTWRPKADSPLMMSWTAFHPALR